MLAHARHVSLRTPQTADFEREIRLLRELRHSNIVFFYGAGIWSDGLPFYVTEMCKKGSLRDLLDDAKVVIPVARGADPSRAPKTALKPARLAIIDPQNATGRRSPH